MKNLSNGKISGKRTKKLNMIAALCDNELIAPFVYHSHMNTDLFNCYLQVMLLPLLAVGTAIMMDNAKYHLSEETRRLIEEKVVSCSGVLLHPYLPPYSPDLNKIEKYLKKYRPYFPTLKDTLSFVFNFILSPLLFISL